MEEDGTLGQLRSTLVRLKEEMNVLIGEVLEDRKDSEAIQLELMKMRKEKEYLEGLIREKTEAIRDYDRIIGESEKTLSKLTDGARKLLLTLESTSQKLLK
jgi:hypothetical protein